MFNFAHTETGMLSGYPPGRTGISIGVIYIGKGRLSGRESRSECP